MAQAKEPVSIDGITFDALIDSDESWQSDIPAYPVEAGFEVSDTIIIRPLTLNMKLYLTNTPVSWHERHGASPFRVQDVIQRLRYLYLQRTPVTVKTSEQDYQDMAIVSIGLPKNVNTGTSRIVPISLQQIIVTQRQTSGIPASYGKGGATGTNAGTAGISAGGASSWPGQSTGPSGDLLGGGLFGLPIGSIGGFGADSAQDGSGGRDGIAWSLINSFRN